MAQSTLSKKSVLWNMIQRYVYYLPHIKGDKGTEIIKMFKCGGHACKIVKRKGGIEVLISHDIGC